MLDGSARLNTMRPMPKELQAEIKSCIDKHTSALAGELAELFRASMVERFTRTLDEVKQEAAPAPERAKRSPVTPAPKKQSPSVVRAKKRRQRKTSNPEGVRKPKKSSAEYGEDIVEYIRNNPGCGAADVMKGLGMRQTTWMRAKLIVQKAARIRMTGEPRRARYFVTDTIVRRSAA